MAGESGGSPEVSYAVSILWRVDSRRRAVMPELWSSIRTYAIS